MLKHKLQTNTEPLSKWTAIMLFCLLFIYYMVTLLNTNTIVEQVEMMGEHPFPVAIAAGDIDSGLSQLRSLPERLIYSRSDSVITTVQYHYDAIDESIAENLSFIISKYSYRPEDAVKLQLAYFELREDQNTLLTLCTDSSYTSEDVAAYYTENLVPKLDEITSLNDSIISGAQIKYADLERLVHDSRRSMITFSTILILAVITSLLIYLQLLKEKNRKEEEMGRVLREALDLAQNANAAKSRFLFNMSHDIRTPMNAIIGMTAIAGMHLEEPAKVKDCLSKISASSKHLLGLINDVLDMSKIENGKIALNNENFVLPELVRSFMTIVHPQAKAKQLTLDISVKELEHERVIGDTLRINQILLNIIGNAIKFTPDGGTVNLKIQELPIQYSGYGSYQFIISDTGIGIPKDFIDKIFDAFERVQTSTNSKIEGTGLGMAITKNIVDMMNGQISVESELGKGTTFTVTLPLKLQASEDEEFDFSALRELRTLVVDDDRDVCENTSRLLEEIGMKSEWVLSGADAVSRTIEAHEKNQDYHSVIIDWKMPDMDGFETTRRIRSIVGADVPIIILTAYDWTEIERDAKEAGVDAFLSKPLFKSCLYNVMQNILLGEHPSSKAAKTTSANTTFEGRILLVEDNTLNMEIAVEFLKRFGPAIDTAWDGREAVQMVTDAPDGYYNLLFMDIQMPHMDGYDASRRIRQLEQSEERRHTPIIAMSANAFAEDIDKAYEAGMDSYITKPININEILDVLQKYLAD